MTVAPVKRGPGRPRKTPPKPVVAAPVETAAPEAPAPEEVPAPAPKPTKAFPDDERIGLDVHPTASHHGFDDGTMYRCEDGKIVERVL